MPVSIHREGYKIIVVTFLVLAAFNLAFHYSNLLPYKGLYLLMGLSIAFFLFIAYFFRKPRRAMITDAQCIVAPCDGKIVTIEETHEVEYFNEKRLLVSIFMSPSNVHINWNPISGIVKYVKYHPGKYLVAYNPKSSTHNERNTLVIEDDGVEVLVRQVAGVLARRIVHYVEEGQQVMQGAEFGFIKFGSRIDLYLPLDAQVEVNLKQKVRGGKTIIARMPQD